MAARVGLRLSCDGLDGAIKCPGEVMRTPRIVIPTRPETPPCKPIEIWTPIHYCNRHAHRFDVQDYLTQGGQKARIEREARALRGPDFRPDFDNAQVKIDLVTTPEYRAYVQQKLGVTFEKAD